MPNVRHAFAMLSLRWCTAQAALRDYYNADGNDLNDLINKAKNLPPEANVAGAFISPDHISVYLQDELSGRIETSRISKKS